MGGLRTPGGFPETLSVSWSSGVAQGLGTEGPSQCRVTPTRFVLSGGPRGCVLRGQCHRGQQGSSVITSPSSTKSRGFHETIASCAHPNPVRSSGDSELHPAGGATEHLPWGVKCQGWGLALGGLHLTSDSGPSPCRMPPSLLAQWPKEAADGPEPQRCGYPPRSGDGSRSSG